VSADVRVPASTTIATTVVELFEEVRGLTWSQVDASTERDHLESTHWTHVARAGLYVEAEGSVAEELGLRITCVPLRRTPVAQPTPDLTARHQGN
jgi:hypothetical protein